MIMAVALRFSITDRGHRSDASGHNEIDCNSLKCNLGQHNVGLQCITY